MPLLTLAGRTEVVAVADAVKKGYEFDGIDIDQHYAHHEVDVKVNPIIREGMVVADVLVSYAADSGADLIVMSGYGHSPPRQFWAVRHVTCRVS